MGDKKIDKLNHLKHEFQCYYKKKLFRFLKNNNLYNDKRKLIKKHKCFLNYRACYIHLYPQHTLFIGLGYNRRFLNIIKTKYVNYIINIFEIYFEKKMEEKDIILLNNLINEYSLSGFRDYYLKSNNAINLSNEITFYFSF